jgi:hypothetical protein
MLMTTNNNVLIEEAILGSIHMEMVLTVIAMVVSGIKIVVIMNGTSTIEVLTAETQM